MGIASVSAGLTLIPASLVWHQQNSEIIFAVAMAALVVFRHQSNIRAALAARLNK
jgi:glycerol-3-phosphate acyltransferase PlsY